MADPCPNLMSKPSRTSSARTPSQLLTTALAAHQAGRLEKAAEGYRALLRLDPRNAEALHLFGMLHYQCGELSQAETLLRQALEIVEHPVLFNNLGTILKAYGKQPEAEAAYRRAIALHPDYAEAHNNLGTLFQEQQRLHEAEAAYLRAQALAPSDVSVPFNLALLYHAAQRPDAAEAAYRRALAIQPDFVTAAYSLAVLLEQQGRTEEAEAAYRQTLVLAPAHAEAHNNLGNLLKNRGDTAAAENEYRQAIALLPGYASAHYNLGLLLQEMQHLDEAEAAYRQAIAHQPDYAEALNNLGNLLREKQQEHAAETVLRQALALRPDYADAQYNLGCLLLQHKRFAEAEQALRSSLALQPDRADALNNLGLLLEEQKRLPEAEAAYRQSIAVQPGYAEGYNHLGNVLFEQKRYADAEEAYRQAVTIRPDFADAHYNLGYLLAELKFLPEAESALERALQLEPRLGKALGLLTVIKRNLCAWEGLEQTDRALAELIATGRPSDISPFVLLALPSLGAREQEQANRLYAEHKFPSELSSPPLIAPSLHRQNERLRIGYLSADFHEHATMYLLAGVLEQHDRQRCDIRLYSYGPSTGDSVQQRLRTGDLPFNELNSLSDEAAAQRIADDGIDILVDLKGHTQNSRLGISARRPAPVIVSWLGYPATLGHPRLADYLIGDAIVSPPEHAAHFSETLALMPHCYQPNDHSRVIGPCPTRAQAGLPEQGFVFACFNQGYKFTPEILSLWCRLLLQVPGSVLWLLQPHDVAITNLRRETAMRGVEPDRLIFAPSLPLAEHLGRLQLADLALDTFPVTSHTTASDALWAGVPLITRRGDTFVSRVAASLLHAIGLPELVTDNWDAYFALAKDLALDSGKLARLRDKLTGQKALAPLFDTAGFTHSLERLFLRIRHQHERGEKALLMP